MEQTVMNVRVDKEDKRRFDEFCNQVGMNISVAVNMFVKNVIREQKLPFEIYLSKYNAETESAIEEAQEILAGKRKGKRYKSVDEAFSNK